MRHSLVVAMVFPGVLLLAAGCEPEQEGTPLAPQETRGQEQAVPVEEEESRERDTSEPQLHVASGSVVSVDPENRQITLDHGHVESLGWPEMTMPFEVADPELLEGLEPGMQVEFAFRELAPGEYVIDEIEPEQE